MSIQISPVIAAQTQGHGGAFSIKAIDLHKLGERASPIIVLDEFRVRGRPFPPHPHAGFSAVTYVFEDSQGSLRSRDSLGNDRVIGPGGICWTQAGSGVVHEELPAEPNRELHGLQVFVNLSSNNKFTVPDVFRLEGSEVPEWRNTARDRVRVVVGSFENVASPLITSEAFNLLDVQLQSEIHLDLQSAHNAVIYVITGAVLVGADGAEQRVAPENAVAVGGTGGRATFKAVHLSHFVILSGAAICEPVAVDGPFIMNDRAQIEAAIARYRSGKMGRLAPLADN